MLAASQDIDSFIEQQRSQLNKQNVRQPAQRPPPPQRQQQQQQPPPPPPPANVHDRLDFKVARILEEPAPRVQPYYRSNSPPPPPPVAEPAASYYAERQDFRRPSNEMVEENSSAFFNKFGTYEDKRTQLKDDLKREYNEFLQSKNRLPKSKSTSQVTSPRGNNNNRRVQFQPNGKVVAPWEKGDGKGNSNAQSVQDVSFNSNDYPSSNRSRPQVVRNHDEQYVRDKEEYIAELHAQIRELEARRRELETQSNKLSAGPTSNVTRAHYKEDLNALNSLLAERLDQRNAVDFELAHILNRPPVSTSPTRLGSGPMPMMNNVPMQQSNNPSFPPTNQRQNGPPGNRPDPRARPGDGFQIGHEVDKDSEQAAKKRYQQELQAQMREAQMRKAQSKREKDEYDRKLDAEIQRYNYFGRSGGGAPMRDRDGNVVANLSDLRNPPNGPPQQQQQLPPGQQPYSMPDDKVYSLGNGSSSILNAPFYNGEQQQSSYPANTERAGSPNHARGAMSNGIFGAAKTEEQFAREEKYKQELKKQIDEKRQREVDEAARRRAEEEREMAKHMEWQQQMERQTAEEAARKQDKENQDRAQHQQRQEELERQKQAEEVAARRKPKRVEKPMTPKRETSDDYAQRQNTYDEPDQQRPPPATDTAYRSSSPPIPTLKNKGKKTKPKVAPPAQPPSFDDDNGPPPENSPPPLPALATDDDYMQQNTPTPPANAMRSSHGQQTYRKPPTPGQPDVTSARKKPPPTQTHHTRARPSSNTGHAIRTNSALSLRSDGSDSEVLNRLEHLKRQLKDKEARLQEHVIRHQTDTTSTSQVHETTKTTYQPPTSRKQSPGFLLNAARMHHRDSPTNNYHAGRLLQADDDLEYKPGYFRDDTILMSGAAAGTAGQDYYPSKRVDSADRLFDTKIERAANQRKYGLDANQYYDREDPTAMANYELNRIAEQNEQRLKKLRDLEHDDVSLLDSNEVLERFQQRQRLQRGGSQTTLQDDAWLK